MTPTTTGDMAAISTKLGVLEIAPFVDSPRSSSSSSFLGAGHETPMTDVSEVALPAPPKRRAPTPPAAIALAAASADPDPEDDPFDMAAIRHSLRYMARRDAALLAEAKQQSQTATQRMEQHQAPRTPLKTHSTLKFGPQAPLTPPRSPNQHFVDTFSPSEVNRPTDLSPPDSPQLPEWPAQTTLDATVFEQPVRYSPHLTVDRKALSSKRLAMIDVYAASGRRSSSQQSTRPSIEHSPKDVTRASPFIQYSKKRKTCESGTFARTISSPMLTPATHVGLETAEAGLPSRFPQGQLSRRKHCRDIDEDKIMVLPVLPLHESRLVSARAGPLRAAPSPCSSASATNRSTPRPSEAEPTSGWDSDDDDDIFNLVSRVKSSLHIAERPGSGRDVIRRPQRRGGYLKRMIQGRVLCSGTMG